MKKSKISEKICLWNRAKLLHFKVGAIDNDLQWLNYNIRDQKKENGVSQISKTLISELTKIESLYKKRLKENASRAINTYRKVRKEIG